MLYRIIIAICALMLGHSAHGNDYRDPVGKQFSIWPNIPIIRASDFEEYGLDRSIFAKLHLKQADPNEMIEALKAVDSLQTHNQSRSINELGRSINVELMSELDKMARDNNIKTPKIRFDYNGISPQDLQRSRAADAKELDKLKADVAKVTLIGYITYTQLSKKRITATLTLIKLANGESQSFSITAPSSDASVVLAREVFNYFYGNRYSYHKNTMARMGWLPSAPGHIDQLVSHEMANNYCKSQGADLPNANEYQAGEAAGFYHGGIAMKPYSYYHLKTGLYYSSETEDVRGRIRNNPEGNASNGYYYCIKRVLAKK